MKIAWDEIAVIFIALFGVVLAYDWWKAKTTPIGAPEPQTILAPSAPTTAEAYNDLHHAGADSIE